MSVRPDPDAEWTHVEGSKASRVVVYEDKARGGMLTLRWRVASRKNYRRKTLGRVLERDRRNQPVKACVQWAIQEAKRKSVALGDGLEAAEAVKVSPFTIGETKAALTDSETGPYPHDTEFRRELVRALVLAGLVWGEDTAWHAVDDAAWTKLMRRRLGGLLDRKKQGIRSTEITISRLNTAAEWLRDQKRIPRDAALLPKKWRAKLLDFWRGEVAKRQERSPAEIEDPKPSRPRHTLAEMRKIIAAAPKIDPRFGLLLALAAEYRLGQARRAKRSHLNLAGGTFTIGGRGKKLGAVVDMTAGQLAAWATATGPGGYLEATEGAWLTKGRDYYLFPAGKMLGRRAGEWMLGAGIDYEACVSREWITANFHAAEDLAGVAKVKGRAAYGLRRQNVDAMNEEGISPLGKQAAGGWSSTKVPDSIYAESTNQVGRTEAKKVRARTRGETPEEAP